MFDNHNHRVLDIVFCTESILLIKTHSLYALRFSIIGCMSPAICFGIYAWKVNSEVNMGLQFAHLRSTASIVLDCIQGLYNMEPLRFWSHPHQGIPGRWCCCHSQTSCTTDMRWWRHAYVVLQWNWPKGYHFCFLSSREATTHNIFRFYCCNAPKLPTHCIHCNTVQLLLVLRQLLRWMSRAEQIFHIGCFCRSPCLEGKSSSTMYLLHRKDSICS